MFFISVGEGSIDVEDFSSEGLIGNAFSNVDNSIDADTYKGIKP